jgi:hypothetical protein
MRRVVFMPELSQAERTAMEMEMRSYQRDDMTDLPRPFTNGFERGFLAARDYGRERERALEEALRSIAGHPKGDAPMGAEAAQRIARNALAASQPEVLSERSDTEPGEPEDLREFVLWADHTWTGGNEESDEIENASLNVVPKSPQSAATSPGEPEKICPYCVEGHTHDVCDGEPVVEVCGSCHGTGKEAQPDRGPGEPSPEDVLRDDAIHHMATISGQLRVAARDGEYVEPDELKRMGDELAGSCKRCRAVLAGESNG